MPSFEGTLPYSMSPDVPVDSSNALVQIIRQLVTGAPIADQTWTIDGNSRARISDVYSKVPGGPAENWTLTFSSATTFNVLGSVSGSLPAGTVGVRYDETEISFLVQTLPDLPAPQIGDRLEFSTASNPFTTAGERWTIDDDFNSAKIGYHFEAPGISQTEEIKLLIRASTLPFLNGTERSNLRFMGSTGYSGSPGDTQIGDSTVAFLNLSDGPIKYWLNVNGDRLIGVVQTDNIFRWFYVGFLATYLRTSEWSYPLYVAAQSSSSLTKWNAGEQEPSNRKASDLGSPLFNQVGDGAYLRYGSSWVTIKDAEITNLDNNEPSMWWPGGRTPNGGAPHINGNEWIWSHRPVSRLVLNQGSLPAAPLIPPQLMSYGDVTTPTGNIAVWGTMDGIYVVPGQYMIMGEKISIMGNDYLIFNENNRREDWRIYALRLD